MKTLLLAGIFGTTAVISSFAAGEGWTHDFSDAKKQAAELDKALLMDFTGSDWCGWCVRLNEEVFQKEVFKTWAKDKFVLVELDFPKDTSKLSEETQRQNAELGEEYAIQGYPTILLADAKGRPFARTGYQEGGAEAYVKHLEELLELETKRDAAIAAARKEQGVKKAEALLAALRAMPIDDVLLARFYREVIEEIKAADPDDTTGFVKSLEAREKFAEFESKLSALGQTGDHASALELVSEALASGNFEGEQQQQITLIKGFIHAEMEDFDKALMIMDEAKAIAPESELAARIETFKERLLQMKAETAAGDGEDGGKPEKDDAAE